MRKDRVLIASSEKAQHRILRELLEELEVEMEFVHDAQVVLGKVSTFELDLILLDEFGPEYSGVELCRSVKSDTKLRSTIVLLMTRLSESSTIQRAVEAGFDDFIRLPIQDNDSVKTEVKTLLELARVIECLAATTSNTGHVSALNIPSNSLTRDSNPLAFEVTPGLRRSFKLASQVESRYDGVRSAMSAGQNESCLGMRMKSFTTLGVLPQSVTALFGIGAVVFST